MTRVKYKVAKITTWIHYIQLSIVFKFNFFSNFYFLDDLAQVDYVEAAQNQVSVKTIPRIDYNKARGFNSVRAAPRAKNQRPQQKLFNEDSIRAIGGDISNDGDFLIFEGARYSRKVRFLTPASERNKLEYKNAKIWFENNKNIIKNLHQKITFRDLKNFRFYEKN